MSYSFEGKPAEQILRDLEKNNIQGAQFGGNACEIAAAAMQAAIARENRRLQFRLTVVSLCLSVASIVVAVIALAR